MLTTTKSLLVLLFFFSSCNLFANEAEFKFDNHCLNNLIYFEDLSTTEEDIVSWYWDFGDESISMDQNPVHAYTESGTYQVKLTIRTVKNNSFDISKPIKIVAPPFAFFDPNELCNKEVEFNDNSFTKASEVKMWMWDFGDGTYSLDKNPKHKFEEGKTTKVNLKIMDYNGCGDSITQTVHLKSLPETGFDIKNVVLTNPAVIKINSRNQTDSVFYLINNNLINSKNTTVTIPANEVIDITQKVINSAGCSDSLVQTIHANDEYYLSLPAHFSPLNGTTSSTYGVTNSNVTVAEFDIHDSMGKLVFSGTENDQWNGKENNAGKMAPSGIYFYSLYFETPNGVKVLQKGKFFLAK